MALPVFFLGMFICGQLKGFENVKKSKGEISHS